MKELSKTNKQTFEVYFNPGKLFCVQSNLTLKSWNSVLGHQQLLIKSKRFTAVMIKQNKIVILYFYFISLSFVNSLVVFYLSVLKVLINGRERVWFAISTCDLFNYCRYHIPRLVSVDILFLIIINGFAPSLFTYVMKTDLWV